MSTFQSASWTERKSDLMIKTRGAKLAERNAGIHRVQHVRIYVRKEVIQWGSWFEFSW